MADLREHSITGEKERIDNVKGFFAAVLIVIVIMVAVWTVMSALEWIVAMEDFCKERGAEFHNVASGIINCNDGEEIKSYLMITLWEK